MIQEIFEFLGGLAKYLPEVDVPKRQLTAKEKLFWLGAVVVVYFILYHLTVFGLRTGGAGTDFIQVVTASKTGSFLTLGIGPIVMASLFLQLFVGAGLLNLSLQDPAQKRKFHQMQVVLAIIVAILEGYAFGTNLINNGMSDPVMIGKMGGAAAVGGFLLHLVALQFVLGAVFVIYMDEIVQKWGIGSGISMFIAAGVSATVVNQAISILFLGSNSVLAKFAEGGANAISQSIVAIIPIFSTILIFYLAIYGSLLKVKIPISFAALRASGRPLELPLFYVSNIPVIFAAALFMNVSFVHTAVIGAITPDNQAWMGPLSDVVYMLTPFYVGIDMNTYFSQLMQPTQYLGIPGWGHALIYVTTLSIVAVFFGLFWIEMAKMDAKSIAAQLGQYGANIPGFRQDRRFLEEKLNEYITPLTIAGSFAVGLLAGIADLTGALGTGTGILLTVMILYQFTRQSSEVIQTYFPNFSRIVLGE
jgi:preprotein translocase subunit SecY